LGALHYKSGRYGYADPCYWFPAVFLDNALLCWAILLELNAIQPTSIIVIDLGVFKLRDRVPFIERHRVIYASFGAQRYVNLGITG
jgi:hypothetical protein